jgi:hypothetical protein
VRLAAVADARLNREMEIKFGNYFYGRKIKMKLNFLQKLMSAILLCGLSVPVPAQEIRLPPLPDDEIFDRESVAADNLAPEQTAVFFNSAPITISDDGNFVSVIPVYAPKGD